MLSLIGLSGSGAIALSPASATPTAAVTVAQGVANHPFADHSIVYVETADGWREAFIAGIAQRWSRGQVGWLYTVDFLDAIGGTATSVTPDRMVTVEAAQAQGLTDNVYDLSTPAGIDQMLTAHNAARQAVGVPDLTWSAELAAYAQDWANQLMGAGGNLRHRSPAEQTLQNVGENLSGSQATSAGGALQHADRVVTAWVAEQADYDYASNSCAAGQVCGHYTQVVWRDTTEVGCGVARNADATREVWVCSYAPVGNYVGERPY